MCSLGTRAEDITFNTRWWNSTARTVGTTSMTIDCQDVAELIGGSSSPTLTDEGPTLGYYFVRGVNDVRDMPMVVKGTVHLVLCDGALLRCFQGLRLQLADEAVLHIHSCSNGGNQGQLNVVNDETNEAGIGGANDYDGGDLIVHGGIISATGGTDAAGIGGGDDGRSGHVVVYAGMLIAQGGKNGAGIGGGNGGDGSHYADNRLLTVYGGEVTATGGDDGAGIGGGWGDYHPIEGDPCNAGGLVTIWGGKVTAQGGSSAAGIGSGGNWSANNGSAQSLGTTIIHGGEVTATGGEGAAGIGGGKYAKDLRGNYVEITGGTVVAQGGRQGAGIGSGEGGECLTVRISGGTVTARGGYYGAGIGGQARKVKTATVTISGGTVKAYGGEEGAGIGSGAYNPDSNDQYNAVPLTVTGGDVWAQAGEGHVACGIGGSSRSEMGTAGADVVITGGRVTAISAYSDKDWSYANGAIGGTNGFEDNGRLEIPEGYSVSWGTSVETLVPVAYADRVSACRDRTHLCVRIEPCQHLMLDQSALTAVSGEEHEGTCLNCLSPTGHQLHEFDADGFCACGLATLLDPADNTPRLDEWYGRSMSVAISGRRLLKNGEWQTLCLPFGLLELTNTPLEDADIRALTGSSYAKGTLTLELTKVSTVKAGQPYLVRWERPDGYEHFEDNFDINHPMFDCVTIETAEPTPAVTPYATLTGVFDPTTLAAGDRTVLFMGADSKLYWPAEDVKVKAFRAYLKLADGLTAADLPQGVKQVVLSFDGDTTPIGSMPQVDAETANDVWYAVSGQRLGVQPTKKGLYIHGGKKVIVK